MRQIGILLLALCACLTATAYDVEVDGFYFDINDDGVSATLVGYNPDYSFYRKGFVDVPDSVPAGTSSERKVAVTTIGIRALKNFGFKTNSPLRLPETIERLENYCFEDYGRDDSENDNKGIALPKSIRYIGYGAFSSQYGKRNVLCNADNPNHITLDIGALGSIQKLWVQATSAVAYRQADRWKDIPEIVELDAYDFMVDGLAYNINEDESSVSVTYTSGIMDSEGAHNSSYRNVLAFAYNYPDLTSANIPSQVKYNGKTYEVSGITYGAFRCGKSITHVTIPETMRTVQGIPINHETTIHWPASDYGETAFQYCPIKSVEWRAVDFWCNGGNDVSPPLGLFGPYRLISGNVEEIVLGDKVEYIPANFGRWSDITSLAIPASVKQIGRDAFVGCQNLKSLVIPSTLQSLSGALSVFGGYPFNSEYP